MLATWGVVNPTILLPAAAQGWAHDRIHAVLHHELAHVLRGDWVVALTANLLRTLYWFNPVLWIGVPPIATRGLSEHAMTSCSRQVSVVRNTQRI